MNRNEFLTRLWKSIFRPLVVLAVIYFCVRFLISVFSEAGTSRALVMIVLILTILFSLAFLLGTVLGKMKDKIYAKLSDRAKFRLRMISEIINYLSPIVLGAVLYNFWQKEAFWVSFLIVLLLADRIKALLSEKKTSA